MDLNRMIAELQEERLRLTEVIEALERLATGGQKRRGRPPKWKTVDLAKDSSSTAKSTNIQPTLVKRHGA